MHSYYNFNFAVTRGLEPPTPTVTGWCSNQLNYATILRSIRESNPSPSIDSAIS